MYYELIQQCAQSLANIETCLDKAEQYSAARHIDIEKLLDGRLAPDMQPLIYQVQSACDYVKGGAAWLSGQTPPSHPDTERTIGELRERIRKTVDFVRSVPQNRFEGASERRISLSWVPGKVIHGQEYVFEITIPNVFFHLSMAYAILRMSGVDVGKMDFLGNLTMVDA
jgi:hypothetical protein